MNGRNRMFVDINIIQTMPPNCANRDDTGSPKTCVYGGVRRARVSSQSWKKATRDYFHEHFDQENISTRTKKIVELISNRITELDETKSGEEAMALAIGILDAAGIKTKSKKKGKKTSDDSTEDSPETGALFFISYAQVNALANLALKGENNKAKEALKAGMGVEIALFGRMVAEDPSLNSDASAQVSHSISTHMVENEYDFYTAMDEMSSDDNAGAGMIGTVEFNSSTLYRYGTIAVHDLENILGSKEATAKAIREFTEAFILSMPTGKQNTFANRTVPHAVYIAIREDQPVSLAPAFENPVRFKKGEGGYNEASVERMVQYQEQTCKDFVKKPCMSWQIGGGLESLGPSYDLETVLESIERYILEN